jgi:hypothetical protein
MHKEDQTRVEKKSSEAKVAESKTIIEPPTINPIRTEDVICDFCKVRGRSSARIKTARREEETWENIAVERN